MYGNLPNKQKRTDDLSDKDKQIDIALSILIFFFSGCALVISALPALTEKPLQTTLTFVFGIFALLLAILISYLYCRKRINQKKMVVSEIELKAERKKNQIYNLIFQSLQEANSEKTVETLRYTYGEVCEWNPIDYTKNWLAYDVHSRIRAILGNLQNVVINIAPDRFNDKNVSVDLVCCYAEDAPEAVELPIVGSSQQNTSSTNKGKNKPWKLISSPDLSGNHRKTIEYLADPFSFYTFISFFGSWFANNKYKKQSFAEKTTNQVSKSGTALINSFQGQLFSQIKIADPSMSSEDQEKVKKMIQEFVDNGVFFRPDVKDLECAKCNSTKKLLDGSAIGTTICVRNDNPEHVLVKSILTINTYGEPIHVPKKDDPTYAEKGLDEDGLSEEDYEKLFLSQILCSYSTLIASELSQMYIRHQLKENKIDPHSGKPVTTSNSNS